MTTIDRAGLDERLSAAYEAVNEWPEKRGDPMEVGGAGFMDLLALRNLVPEAIAALRKPDQKGEATDQSELQHPAGETIRARQGNARGAVSDDRSVPVGAAPHPTSAPEAGKLPSEEEIIEAWERGFCNSCGRRNGPNDCTLSDDPEICGESYKRCNWRNPTPAESARAVRALLSPAQPHDVPAGDGDGLVQRFQEGVATGRAAAFAEAIELARLEAEQHRGFLKEGTVPRAEATLCILTAREIQNAIARASRSTSGRA